MNKDIKTKYLILKAIDDSFIEASFDLHKTFDLEKLDISRKELEILLEDYIEEKLIKDILVVKHDNGFSLIPYNPRLTPAGRAFLEKNATVD